MNMGSMNFSFHPLAKRYADDDWKFDWEKDYVAGSDGNIFRNTFRDIREGGDDAGAPRHQVRARMLRCRPSLQPEILHGHRAVQGAGLHPVRDGHPRRHRGRRGKPRVHEEDRRQAVRRQLPLVDPGRGLGADPDGDDGEPDRRQRAGRARRQPVHLARQNWPRATPSRSPRSAGSSRSWAAEVATPDEAREILDLKGGDRVDF